MIGKGSLVRYNGQDKRLWYNKLLMVQERNGDRIIAYLERTGKGKWSTIEVSLNEVEEVR